VKILTLILGGHPVEWRLQSLLHGRLLVGFVRLLHGGLLVGVAQNVGCRVIVASNQPGSHQRSHRGVVQVGVERGVAGAEEVVVGVQARGQVLHCYEMPGGGGLVLHLKGSFGGVVDLYDAALHLGPVQRSLRLVCVLGVVEGHETEPLGASVVEDYFSVKNYPEVFEHRLEVGFAESEGDVGHVKAFGNDFLLGRTFRHFFFVLNFFFYFVILNGIFVSVALDLLKCYTQAV